MQLCSSRTFCRVYHTRQPVPVSLSTPFFLLSDAAAAAESFPCACSGAHRGGRRLARTSTRNRAVALGHKSSHWHCVAEKERQPRPSAPACPSLISFTPSDVTPLCGQHTTPSSPTLQERQFKDQGDHAHSPSTQHVSTQKTERCCYVPVFCLQLYRQPACFQISDSSSLATLGTVSGRQCQRR